VPAKEGSDRAHDRRRACLPGAGASVARADGRDDRRALPAGWARADQPDLALGPISHVLLDEWRTAGLVPRLADRRPSTCAELRPDDRRLHARAESILGRGGLPARRLRLP